MKIKKGDTVVITAGKFRSKSGKVIRVFSKFGKIFIENIVQKRHKRSRAQQKKGEIISIPLALDVSNVKILCSRCGKTTRVGHSISNGIKTRICKKCQQSID